MKNNTTTFSLLIALGSLFLIPTTAYSTSLNQINSLTKIEKSIALIAQNNNEPNNNPNNNEPNDLMNQGWDLYNNQQYQEAINYYDQAINLNPNFVEAWLAKAIALYDLEKYEEAITSLDEVINLDQTNADAYGMRGAIHILMKNQEKGISDLQKAAALYQSQNQQQAYQDTLELLQIVQSESFNQTEQTEQTETTEDANNVVNFEEDNPYLYFDQGYSFYESKQYEEAINSFSKAIEIKPDFAEAYGLRGGVYFALGNKEEALSDLEIAAQLFTDQNDTEGYQKIQELIQLVQEN